MSYIIGLNSTLWYCYIYIYSGRYTSTIIVLVWTSSSAHSVLYDGEALRSDLITVLSSAVGQCIVRWIEIEIECIL